MKTHIPGLDGRTYCGRPVTRDTPHDWHTKPRVINVHGRVGYVRGIPEDCIDEATCQACHRSDDRRTREDYQKTEEYRQQRRELEGR